MVYGFPPVKLDPYRQREWNISVTEELTAYDLPVTGRVPDRLNGWYLRNGPNPHDAASGHWFFGDGMIHGVRLDGGRATSYRNRWVRTKTFTDGAPVRDAMGRLDLAAGAANTLGLLCRRCHATSVPVGPVAVSECLSLCC